MHTTRTTELPVATVVGQRKQDEHGNTRARFLVQPVCTAGSDRRSRIRHLPIPAGTELLDLGGGDGSAVGIAHANRGVNLTVVDQNIAVEDAEGRRSVGHPNIRRVAADLDGDWPTAIVLIIFRLPASITETVF